MMKARDMKVQPKKVNFQQKMLMIIISVGVYSQLTVYFEHPFVYHDTNDLDPLYNVQKFRKVYG